MNPLQKFRKECADIVGEHAKLLEASKHSDLALPCFRIAKEQKRSPVEVAQQLREEFSARIKKGSLIKEIKMTGPYLNFYIDEQKFQKLILKQISKQGRAFGSGKKKKHKIMVEFAHPNTHKAYHIGHVRNICTGESISRILEFAGNKVIRTNYQGDVGPHVAKCIWQYMNHKDKEPSNIIEKGKWLGILYALANKAMKENPDLESEIQELNKKIYEKDRSIINVWKKTRSWSLKYFDKIYKDFGVKFDRLYFESETANLGTKIAKNVLKQGKAIMSEGAIVIDLGELGIFLLLKSDGTPLYSTKDLGLAKLEFGEFKPDKIVHVVAEEQELYSDSYLKHSST